MPSPADEGAEDEWEAVTARLEVLVEEVGPDDLVLSSLWLGSGELLLRSGEGWIQIVAPLTGEVRLELQVGAPVERLLIDSAGARLLSASPGEARLWSLPEGAPVAALEGYRSADGACATPIAWLLIITSKGEVGERGEGEA